MFTWPFNFQFLLRKKSEICSLNYETWDIQRRFAIYLSLCLSVKDFQATEEAVSPQKRTSCTQNITFFIFLYLLVIFPGLRIRIHFIRIRIQHFRMNTNPDPDTIRNQGFNDQKLKKNYSWNFFIYQTAINLSLGLHKVCPSYRRSLQRPSNTSKHELLQIFFYFCGSFLPFWIRIRIPNQDPDLDSESGSGSTDPIESGSNPDPQPCIFPLLDPGPLTWLNPDHKHCLGVARAGSELKILNFNGLLKIGLFPPLFIVLKRWWFEIWTYVPDFMI